MQILADRHLWRIDSADDEVNRVGVILSPLWVFFGSNKGVGTELASVVGLARVTGDGNNFVGTESLGPKESIVARDRLLAYCSGYMNSEGGY